MTTTTEVVYTLRPEIEQLITFESANGDVYILTFYFDATAELEIDHADGKFTGPLEVTSVTRDDGTMFITGPNLEVSLCGELTV